MTKAKPLPPLELVQQLLDYDPEAGTFFWKDNRGKKRCKDKPAGSPQKGYISIHINGEDYRAHRLAWLHATGRDPLDFQIDHIDGDKTNNRFANLREASNSQNQCNAKRRINNQSGYKGVCWSKYKRKWRAEITAHGKKLYLGYFDTPELAHMAYAKAAAELHGEFARAA